MSDSDIRLQKLEEAVHTIKREVDALQIESAKASRPWYETPAVLVALFALLFSFGTTLFSYVRTRQQDIRAARRELYGLIQRLGDLAREEVQLGINYPQGSPPANLRDALRKEEQILIAQAADIATSFSDNLSSGSLLAVADAVYRGAQVQRSWDFAKLAVSRANNFSDEVAAARIYAHRLFVAGEFDEGAKQFQIAIDAIDKYPQDADPKYKAASRIRTLIYWGEEELSAGRCEEAITRASEATKHYKTLKANPQQGELGERLTYLEQGLSHTCPQSHSTNPELGSTASSQ